MTKANDCAYPADNQTQTEGGLTKREYFAAMAMQGLCLNGAYSKQIQDQCEANETTTSIAIAVYAVDLADELIKVLNNTQ
jgi:hypothetical protein